MRHTDPHHLVVMSHAPGLLVVAAVFLLLGGPLCFPDPTASAPPVWAGTVSYDTIRLDDGSVVKGRITAADERTYRIQTPSFGLITVEREHVVSITPDPGPAPAAASSSPPYDKTFRQQWSRDPALTRRMAETQKRILSDPVLMESLVTLTQDPELGEILSDPNILSDLMNTPYDQWAHHPSLRKLINHPGLKRFIERIRTAP